MIGVSNTVGQDDVRSRAYETPEIPSGLIALWGGEPAEIPSGWLVCDGNNGTPDLVDRYPRITNSGDGTTTDPTSTTVSSSGHSHNLPTSSSVQDFFSRYIEPPASTVTVSYNTFPESVDYIFIQSDGSGELGKGVTPLGKSIETGQGISNNNGSYGTINSVGKTVRSNNSNAGNYFGSDTNSYGHGHSFNNTGTSSSGSELGMYYEVGNVSPNPGSATTKLPTIKYLFLSVVLRYGINSSEINGKVFLYTGDVSNLPSGYNQITPSSDVFLESTDDTSAVEQTTSGNYSADNFSSHNHPLEVKEDDGQESGPISLAGSVDNNSDSIGNPERPPYTDVKLIEASGL